MIISRRNITVDIARIIAAFGVIAIHVSASTKAASEVGNFFSPLCVPFFYLISLTYFIAGLKKESSVVKVFRKDVAKNYFALFCVDTGLCIFYNFKKQVNRIEPCRK